MFVAVAAAASFLLRCASQAKVPNMASTSMAVGSTVPRMIFSLVSRLDEAPLTAGVDDVVGWDEDNESADDDDGSLDDDESVNDDGDLEVWT